MIVLLAIEGLVCFAHTLSWRLITANCVNRGKCSAG